MFHFSPKKINPRFAQYIKCTACERKEEWTCCESGWSSDEHLLCPPFILFLAPPLLSLLWAVIDLIPSSLNWSHDSCCSDWPSLTTHRHSSVMLSPIYLSICLCLLSLSPPSGESTCWPYRAGTAWFVPTCIWSVLLWFLLLRSKTNIINPSCCTNKICKYREGFFRSLMQSELNCCWVLLWAANVSCYSFCDEATGSSHEPPNVRGCGCCVCS